MTDFSLTRSQGETIAFSVGPIQRAGRSIDLGAAGTKLVVTGKIRADDETPVFVKDFYADGGAPHGGIVITPATTDTVDVIVPADEAGVLALTKTTYVQVDALLIEASGTQTIVSRGVLKIRQTPSG